MATCHTASQASIDEAAALIACRLPTPNAVVGRQLASRVKGPDNPKAVISLDDIITQWDVSRKVECHMDKEEFVMLVR